MRRSGAAPLSGTVSIHPGDDPRTCTMHLALQSEEHSVPWHRWMAALAYRDAFVTLADGLAARFTNLVDEDGVPSPPSSRAISGVATSAALDRLPPRDLTQGPLDDVNGVSHG